jgi:hypothetical protein
MSLTRVIIIALAAASFATGAAAQRGTGSGPVAAACQDEIAKYCSHPFCSRPHRQSISSSSSSEMKANADRTVRDQAFKTCQQVPCAHRPE